MAEEHREAKVEKIGRRILHAASADEETIDKIAASPFLYARIRARVAEAQAMPAAVPFYLRLLPLLARRAIPAFALLAVLAVGAYVFAGKNAPPPNPIGVNEAIFVKLEANTPPTACNIANRSECVVSTDDVVAILVQTPESGNR